MQIYLFVLPSLKDPSPLSPIEALASNLPILVSSRIGNSEDVLEPNINGWSYDPVTEKEKAKSIIFEISKLSRNELSVKGLESYRVYNEKFNTDLYINKYAKELKKIINESITS